MSFIGLLVIGWGVWAGVAALRAARQARAGLDLMQAVKGEVVDAGELPTAEVESLAAASTYLAWRDFSASYATLNSPLLWPVRVLPVLGRQLSSARALTRSAEILSAVAERTLSGIRYALEAPRATGKERMALLDLLDSDVGAAVQAVSKVDYGPGDALLAPLAQARAKLADVVGEVAPKLDRAYAVLQGITGMLGAKQNILVIAAANAEMRVGSGSFLLAGTLQSGDGSVRVGPLTLSGPLVVGGRGVAVAPDIEARWGQLMPNHYFDALALSPDFPQVAPAAASMWQATGHPKVSSVVVLDAAGLADLLAATGPLMVNGTLVSSANVVQLVDYQQYAGSPPGGGSQANPIREAVLDYLPGAIMRALEAGRISLPALARSLAQAAEGRHLLVWSADPALERDWVEAGVAGSLAPNDLMVALANLGANKLDPYLSVSAALERASSGSLWSMTLQVTVHNTAPAGPPSLIEGPYPGMDLKAGEYSGVISINIPGSAIEPSVSGPGVVAAWGPEGPTFLVAKTVLLQAGSTSTWTVRFKLPKQVSSLTILPSARIPSEEWSYLGDSFTDSTSTTLRL